MMSALLCLTAISVFLHINFLLKTVAMAAAAATHVVVYFAYIEPRSSEATPSAVAEGFQYRDGDEAR